MEYAYLTIVLLGFAVLVAWYKGKARGEELGYGRGFEDGCRSRK